ncbi:glycoside hydrolase family 26 protein [Chryseobacterium sp. SC28]|uniref:glycoside hydrolase family 26 protein n=1 Tax=Chryseobacterium sp. SC28 TaxID=2268028 RepID=UPI001626712A|nr:glycosyl hydrolase [Chryseobacterium sp. SC28]
MLVCILTYFVLFGNAQVTLLSDPKATPETQNLYRNLWKTLDIGIMFGHQDDLAYGVNWRMQKDRSDVLETAGDYPAVFGWDIMNMELDKAGAIDIFTFKEMKKMIEKVYDKGGVNTISWHTSNPKTGKDAWDNSQETIATILPNGEKHDLYKSWLDKISHYFLSIKGKDKKLVPIIFRPYHELTGGWFWWGKGKCTPEEFKSLWRFTYDYITKEKQVHNLIWMYNTSDFNSKEEFLEAYPGDNYVDMISFDIYLTTNPVYDNSFVQNAQKQFSIMDEIAKQHHKVPALAETGFEQIPYNKFWMKTLMEAIGEFRISYVLAWRNHGLTQENKMHYYVPYKGHPNEHDFKNFYNLDKTLFLKEIQKLEMYK